MTELEDKLSYILSEDRQPEVTDLPITQQILDLIRQSQLDLIKRIKDGLPENKLLPLPGSTPLMTKKWEGYNQAIHETTTLLETIEQELKNE